MPVFRAGASFAQAAASVLGSPCYFTTHQRGHLAAALLGKPDFPQDYLTFHLSGGTTQLLRHRPDGIAVLGGTEDVSAGQLLDRLGVAMGMRFPAGAEMEKLGMDAGPMGRYASSVRGYALHFSGAEAAAVRDMESGAIPPAQIAAELFDVIARSIWKLAAAAAEDTGLSDVLLCGGVASSGLLMELLSARTRKARSALRFVRGEPVLSSDNAVGVALIGLQKYRENGGEGYGDPAVGP
jgi:N6-L-threonylcarbamoyladenine synthase